MKKGIALATAGLLFAGCLASCGKKEKDIDPVVTLPSGYTSVYPEKISGNLHNPGMGWITLEETSWEGKSDLGFSGEMPEIDCIGIQDTWGMIEQEQGVFDWSRIDEAIEYWTERGKRINLRICTDSQTLPETHQGCPYWLFEEYGVAYEWADANDAIYADLTDPVYQYYFDRFMKALAEKYGDNPYVETVDIRGYGKWGEWHSGGDFESIAERVTTLCDVIDTYASAFTDTGKVLFLSATWEFDQTMMPNVVTKDYEEYYTWQGLDYGTTTWDNVSIRRDGGAANIVRYEQDGRFMSEYFRSGKNLPICGEFADGVDAALNEKYGMDTVSSIDDILFTMHPNYCTVLGHINVEVERLISIEGNRLYDRGNEKMGYRFAVDNVRYPTTVEANKEATVITTLSNSALGRFWMEGYDLKLLFLDGEGKEAYRTSIGNFAPHTLLNGDISNYYTEIKPDVPAGEYTLAYSIVDSEGNPAIRMAMGTKEEYESMIYSVGKITVANSVALPEVPFKKTDRDGLKSYKFKKGETYSVTFDYTPGFDMENFEYGTGDGYVVTVGGKEVARWQDASELKGRKTVVFTAEKSGGLEVRSDNFGKIEVGDAYIEKEDGYLEGFDGYDFSSMSAVYYPMDTNRVALTGENPLGGSHSVELKGLSVSCFQDLLKIDESVLKLKNGETYTLSFDAKTTMAGSSGAYFYVALSDTVSGDRTMIGEWLEREDVTAEKYVYTFTVPEDGSYTVVFGVKNMGAYLLDNVLLTENSGDTAVTKGEDQASVLNVKRTTERAISKIEGFEGESIYGTLLTHGWNRWGSLTSDSDKVISGTTSASSLIEPFMTDYLEPENPYYEFLYSNTRVIKLEPMTTYTFEFDYKVLSPIVSREGLKGYMYMFCRSTKLGYTEDKGYLKFAENPELGKVYHMKHTITTGASDDYVFTIGMYYPGEVIVDNALITKVTD